MKLLALLPLAASLTGALAAAAPQITALAKRTDSCVSIPPGPSDTGLDSSLILTTAPTGAATSTAPPAAAITCQHAADPDGAMGLCPNLADAGWCDCGSAGTYAIMAGSNICGYTTAVASDYISLSSTGCASSTTVAVITETVVPVPVSTSS